MATAKPKLRFQRNGQVFRTIAGRDMRQVGRIDCLLGERASHPDWVVKFYEKELGRADYIGTFTTLRAAKAAFVAHYGKFGQ